MTRGILEKTHHPLVDTHYDTPNSTASTNGQGPLGPIGGCWWGASFTRHIWRVAAMISPNVYGMVIFFPLAAIGTVGACSTALEATMMIYAVSAQRYTYMSNIRAFHLNEA